MRTRYKLLIWNIYCGFWALHFILFAPPIIENDTSGWIGWALITTSFIPIFLLLYLLRDGYLE